jgi:5-methylcytosine-specific restriction endonuclease McrBC GTP-binding regulatory subunit McrB
VVYGLSELSDMLKEFNMHFGYRVINEVCRFARLAKSHVAPFDQVTALDIQVVQKILPKFHGTQAKLEEPLGRVLEFAKGSEGGGNAEQVRLPRTARKVSAMLRTLSVQGYADFIE